MFELSGIRIFNIYSIKFTNLKMFVRYFLYIQYPWAKIDLTHLTGPFDAFDWFGHNVSGFSLVQTSQVFVLKICYISAIPPE